MVNNDALAAAAALLTEITKLVERNEPALADIAAGMLKALNALLTALNQPNVTVSPVPPFVVPIYPTPPYEPMAVYYGPQAVPPNWVTITTDSARRRWYDPDPIASEMFTDGADCTSGPAREIFLGTKK